MVCAGRRTGSTVSANWQISPLKGGVPAAPSGTATLLRLRPSYQSYLSWLLPRGVRSPPLGTTGFHGVTGGVYKARERIHRVVLIRDY